MKRATLALLALCIFAASLSGCATFVTPGEVAARFLSNIAAGEYDAAYDDTWEYSAQYYTRDEFVEKYNNIVSGLRITEIQYSELTVTTGDWYSYADYSATYVTEEYGTFENTFRMTLAPTEEGFAVDYTPALIFPEMDFGDAITIRSLPAERGEVFTADGALLAQNGYAQTIYLDMDEVADVTAAAARIQEVAGVDAAETAEKHQLAVERESAVAVIKALGAGTLDKTQIAQLTEVAGVGVDSESMTAVREYPFGKMAAHMTGYATETTAEDVENEGYDGYIPDFTGKTGVEQTYNSYMLEEPGLRVSIVDELGNIIKVLYEKEAVAGADVWLTIDSNLQERSYLAMANYLNSDQSGAVVILNADTGATLSLVSYPSFDPNDFTLGVSEEIWQSLIAEDANTPLYSRYSQGNYPPGSSLKPFTFAAAMENGAMTPSTQFPAIERVIDRRWTPSFETWYYPPITRVDDIDPPVTLENALIKSDNIYFAYSALMLGEDKMVEYLEHLGFGQAYGYDLPMSTSNILNDPANMTRKMLADMGYGQGELLISPIQLAGLFTAFANDGDVLSAYLVDHTARHEGMLYEKTTMHERAVAIESALDTSTVDTLVPIMKRVMTEGTGRPANVRDKVLAGKTGTAEIGDDKSREIGWIIAYDTEGEDRRLVLVMVDGPANKGATKFQVAQELLSYVPDVTPTGAGLDDPVTPDDVPDDAPEDE